MSGISKFYLIDVGSRVEIIEKEGEEGESVTDIKTYRSCNIVRVDKSPMFMAVLGRMIKHIRKAMEEKRLPLLISVEPNTFKELCEFVVSKMSKTKRSGVYGWIKNPEGRAHITIGTAHASVLRITNAADSPTYKKNDLEAGIKGLKVNRLPTT